METLLQRDVKGLYKKAMAGEIQNFTGVNDPYEEPEHPDLVCETDVETVEESAAKVIRLLEERGFIDAGSTAQFIATCPPGTVKFADAAPSSASGGAEKSPAIAVRTVSSGPSADSSGLRSGAGGAGIPGPSVPHGGFLVDRELKGAAREDALERAKTLPKFELDERELADVEMIGVGALSPLTGFMRKLDYETVVESMRLSDGLVWSMPVTKAVTKEQADSIKLDQEIALTDSRGQVVALMQVTEKYTYDKENEARKVFGTTDEAHPGVARLYRQGEVLLGGPIWVVNRPGQDEFAEYRLTPLETRRIFDERGWKSVVAFQTRNPVHRAHEYLQKVAMEIVDGLLLHPLVGATKSDDVPAHVRMKAYHAILDHYYPKDRVLLAVFPAAMRYAGPREAIFHAICRKNYGCTHFIVGRDHAGVGNYYGTYAAQELISQFSFEELGIVPLKFENAFYCRVCQGMATAKTCPHSSEHHVFLSGTKVRAMLQAGELPPAEFSRPEVAQVLIEAARQQIAAAQDRGQ